MLLSLLPMMLAACPIADAEYRLRGDPDVTARFRRVESREEWPSGLALQVRFARTGRSYWFLPWQGGTDGRTNLARVRERHSPIASQGVRSDIALFTTDAAYNLAAAVPRAGDAAPVHLLLPELGDLVWHANTDRRDGAARAFFDLARCSGSRPGDAAPEIEFPAVP